MQNDFSKKKKICAEHTMIGKKGNYYIKIFDDELSNVWRTICLMINEKKANEFFYMQMNFKRAISLLSSKF